MQYNTYYGTDTDVIEAVVKFRYSRTRLVIHRYCTAPIAEVVSALAVVEVFEVPGSNPTRGQQLNFFFRVVHEGRL